MQAPRALLIATLAASLVACLNVPGLNGSPTTASPSPTAPAAPAAVSANAAAPPAMPAAAAPATVAANPDAAPTYRQEEVLTAAKTAFGGMSEGLARAIQRSFADFGEPVAYIEGEEGAAAFIAGARYGQGYLQFKRGERSIIYWQGPTVGFDFGGNATKVFALVYNLETASQLYQRYPGVEGSLYLVAGVSLNYLRSGNIVVAPIHTGVGLRAGASVGYVHYTPQASFIPF